MSLEGRDPVHGTCNVYVVQTGVYPQAYPCSYFLHPLLVMRRAGELHRGTAGSRSVLCPCIPSWQTLLKRAGRVERSSSVNLLPFSPIPPFPDSSIVVLFTTFIYAYIYLFMISECVPSV